MEAFTLDYQVHVVGLSDSLCLAIRPALRLALLSSSPCFVICFALRFSLLCDSLCLFILFACDSLCLAICYIIYQLPHFLISIPRPRSAGLCPLCCRAAPSPSTSCCPGCCISASTWSDGYSAGIDIVLMIVSLIVVGL
jgi:hypothetical protein